MNDVLSRVITPRERGVLLDRAERAAIVEIASLVIACDRRVQPVELETLKGLAALLAAHAGEPTLAPTATAGSMNRDQVDARLRDLVLSLRTLEARRIAYKAARVVATSDRDEADEEFEFDLELIDALDLPQAEVERLLGDLSTHP